jgi:SAM-dependent methyltransferase
MSETPGYDAALARHYDPIYTGLRAASGDVDWYRRLAREAAGPVLELGAGTGRVLLAMAAEGMPCVGLDDSRAMLDELRRKPLPSNVELVLGDMRSFALPRRFALIAAPFRVFQHLDAVEEQLACLACVRRHLAPGGRLAFDVFAPDPAAIALDVHPETEDARYRDGGQEIVRYVTVRVERARQRIHLAIRHEKRRGTVRLGEDRSELRMRYFHRYELEHLLARAGFARVEILGGFRGEPLADDSRDFVVVAGADA